MVDSCWKDLLTSEDQVLKTIKKMEHIELFFKSVFIDNMVFATFLGMCSYLAVSKKVSTAVGLGAAVIFVLAVTVPLNWLLDQYILQEGALVWLGSSIWS